MKNIRKILPDLLRIMLGVVLASIGLKAFLLPNGFLDGGVTGIALLLSSVTDWNISLLLILINVPFLVLAYIVVSRWVFWKSIFSILGLAFFVHFETFDIITEDKLLIAIFGGLFLGLGIGVTIRGGAVLDGSEVLGIYLHERFGLSIGNIILVFNIILFSITAYVIGMEVALYSILTFGVTAKVTDIVIAGFEDYIGITVISDKSTEIRKAFIEEIGLGITIYKGEGGFGKHGAKQDLHIIHTIINRIDIRKVYRTVDEIDKNAFIVEFDVNNVKGGVLRRFLSKSS